MFLNSTVPEQPSEQRQRVISQRAIHEGLLSVERLKGPAARTIILERGID